MVHLKVLSVTGPNTYGLLDCDHQLTKGSLVNIQPFTDELRVMCVEGDVYTLANPNIVLKVKVLNNGSDN